MKKVQPISFPDFLRFFPELELPITLTEESSLEFSMHNKPLPGNAIHEFLLPIESEEDELTEFVPCFRLKETGHFHAIVYWKAGLMNYEYKMVTFNEQGQFIDGKVIAGTLSNGKTIIRTVATVDEDWIIHTVVGEQKVDSASLNKDSRAFSLELLATGEIIFSLNENYE